MLEFKNEQERFKAYFKEISKYIIDITGDMLDMQQNATIINILELLIKVEQIEDRNLRIKFLKAFKEGFKEETFDKLISEEVENNGSKEN